MMTENRPYALVLLLLLMVFLPTAAQTLQEKDALRRQRFSKIEYYHVGAGFETSVNKNLLVGPKVYAGIGSYRNLFCADAGLKLLWRNPTGSADKERVAMWQLPVFISASANLLRWQQNTVYVGGELDYHLMLGANHHVAVGDATVDDEDLGRSYASASLHLGMRLNRWNVSLYCERDLAPAFDQQYVYESAKYDYDALHDAIFERMRFGVSLSYTFPF